MSSIAEANRTAERKMRETIVDSGHTIEQLKGKVEKLEKEMKIRDALIILLMKQLIAFKVQLNMPLTEEEVNFLKINVKKKNEGEK